MLKENWSVFNNVVNGATGNGRPSLLKPANAEREIVQNAIRVNQQTSEQFKKNQIKANRRICCKFYC